MSALSVLKSLQKETSVIRVQIFLRDHDSLEFKLESKKRFSYTITVDSAQCSWRSDGEFVNKDDQEKEIEAAAENVLLTLLKCMFLGNEQLHPVEEKIARKVIEVSLPQTLTGAIAENPPSERKASATKEIPDRAEYDKCTSTKHNSICLARAGDDEPIFVLRAKDETAPATIVYWAATNKSTGAQPDEKIDGAMKLAQEMKVWRNENIKA